MRVDSTTKPLLTRRALLAGAGCMATIAALAGRLYYLQLVAADSYKTLAEDNRIKLQLLAPPRGDILDRNGLPMAVNRPNFRLLLEGDYRQDIAPVIDRLAEHLSIDAAQRKKIMEHMRSRRYPPPLLVREHLDWETVSVLEFHKAELPGMLIDTGEVRHYPLEEYAAHLLGYVGAVSQDDLQDRSLLRLPGFKTGKEGVEKSREVLLRGAPGVRQMEVNVHGLAIRQISQRDSTPGEPVRLTVDARLQEYAAKRFGEESGAAVVLDVVTGGVLALVSMPAYDPNHFSRGIGREYWQELTANERHPLINKAIAGQYPPGSTFKMLVGMAALKHQKARPEEKIFCPGYYYLGNHRFNCWKPQGHGHMNLTKALAHSCDTYFYTMAERLGIEPIAEMARLFGLGTPTGLDLPGEKAGLIPDPEWKRRERSDAWRMGDTINAGIGQGYVLATPLQLAVMTARIANEGFALTPQLFLPQSGVWEKPARLPVDATHLQLIRDGMNAVTNDPQGTAYYRRITDPAMAMAGKTGTSQVRRIKVRGMKQENLPWKYRHHALFVGYAPVDAPRYAVSVIVEHGGGGSAAAAPIARDILLHAQTLGDV